MSLTYGIKPAPWVPENLKHIEPDIPEKKYKFTKIKPE
jgi:hypothetical protein